VIFLKKAPVRKQRAFGAGTDLTQRLVQRGVSATAATGLVRAFSDRVIQEKIEVFDALVGRRDNRVSRNPAGYLVQSIRDDYQIPDSRESVSHRQSAIPRRATPHQVTRPARRRRDRQGAFDHDRRGDVQKYLKGLSPSELVQMEKAAVASATHFLADGYLRARATGNERLFGHYRQAILQYHVEQLMGSAGKQ
jgi:hypothetical protein